MTLFHIKNGNKIGIYTPLSWDTSEEWKGDIETFIFNLNKNEKYKKLKPNYSIFPHPSYGPWTSRFWCSNELGCNGMNLIFIDFNQTNYYYDKGSKILPGNNQTKIYGLL